MYRLLIEHFWDGLGDEKFGATIEIAIELTDYENDPRLLAHLGDCIVDPGPPMMSRLTYRFQPKVGLEDEPSSLVDYEYIIFGGLNPDSSMRAAVRRMLPLDVLGALREAEKDLATWRRSPLRPLIEALTGSLDEAAREEIQEQVVSARTDLADRDEVKSVAETISARLVDIVGLNRAGKSSRNIQTMPFLGPLCCALACKRSSLTPCAAASSSCCLKRWTVVNAGVIPTALNLDLRPISCSN
jgi:putative ATP-dependent endonuclease of the OLD family